MNVATQTVAEMLGAADGREPVLHAWRDAEPDVALCGVRAPMRSTPGWPTHPYRCRACERVAAVLLESGRYKWKLV